MQDYDRKYLKNLFAEHNMANLDYLNNPALLAASLGDPHVRQTHTDTIKHAINNNTRLMSMPYVANNRSFKHAVIDSTSDDKSSSVRHVAVDGMNVYDGRIKIEVDDRMNVANMQSDKVTEKVVNRDRGVGGIKTVADVRTLSKVIEDNEVRQGLMSDTSLARPMTGSNLKYRNIFSATTNANSHGIKLKSKLAGRD